MELQEVVDEEGRLESTHSLVRLLCGLAAHGASDKVLASLDLHGEVGKAVVTERVETGQCPGLSVVIQTDWTGQLLLKILESLTSCARVLWPLIAWSLRFAGRLSEESRQSLACGIDTVYTMYHKLTHSKTVFVTIQVKNLLHN